MGGCRGVNVQIAGLAAIDTRHMKTGRGLGRAPLHALDDLEVPPVQAVEVAKREDRMDEP